MLIFIVGCGFTPKMNSTASKCPQHHVIGYYFCDGFEDGLDSGYSESYNDGAFGIDGVHVYRGATSLHLHANDGAGDAGMTIGTGVSAETSDFINIDPAEADLRMFFYAEGGPVATNVRLVTLGGLQLYLANGDLVLGFERVAAMPMDRWVCVELKMASGGGPWVGSVAIDGGTPVVMGTQLGNEPTGFSLQVEHNDPTRALDVWFDELVLDHRAIGCDS